jgi:hypothetical protein
MMMSAQQKTRTIRRLAIEGARDPVVRNVAARLVRGTERGDYLTRIKRFHAWVRGAVDYHREPIEMFQPAGMTAKQGGDCDDLVILLGALNWSHRLPFRVEPIGHPEGPSHYSVRLGFPESDDPDGDGGTSWFWTEASCAARFDEHPLLAELRLRGGR